MDLVTTIPDFPIESYSHIIPNLEKAKIPVSQLLLLDAVEIAKQTRVPVPEIRRLTNCVLEALHRDLGFDGYETKGKESVPVRLAPPCHDAEHSGGSGDRFKPPSLSFISTLDPVLDDLFAGGISTGYVTEITGESGSGKTQLLLHLLLSVQLPPPYGLSKNALYVSTEADLATRRLSQLLEEHPILTSLPPDTQKPSLDDILGVTTVDLVTQDHILNHHVPAAISRCNVGLLVIDSITANYRAESSTGNMNGLLERAWELKKLGRLLRSLAVEHNIAVVVANQISDRLSNGLPWTEECLPSSFGEGPIAPLSQHLESSPRVPSSLSCKSPTPGMAPSPSSLRNHQSQANFAQSLTPLPPDDGHRTLAAGASRFNVRSSHSVLSFAYQQPFYTGWGDPYDPEPWKTPALGQVWTNELGCRIVLKIHDSRDVIDSHAVEVSSAHQLTASSKKYQAQGEATHAPSKGDCSNFCDAVDKGGGQDSGQNEIGNQGGAEKKTEVHNQLLEKSSGKVETLPVSHSTMIQIPTLRRKRTIEVVFSPWTSGIPSRKCEDTQGIPARCNAVEVEILTTGFRGIPVSRDPTRRF